MKLMVPNPQRSRPPRGFVLIFVLITLVILLIGAVAIARSITAGQQIVGSLGFKRDLANQGERAIEVAMDSVRNSGALADVSARNQDLKTANYKATLLPSNAQSIPLALLSEAEFANVGSAGNDIVIRDLGVTVRYVVDRMATAPGLCGPSTCSMINPTPFGGGSSEWINSQTSEGGTDANPGAVPQQPIYRISVRVSGARKTQSFFQSTFTTN